MNLILILSYVCILIILLRSLSNLKDLISNLRWLKNFSIKDKEPAQQNITFSICIPMLREQRIVEDTIQYFADLEYPLNSYTVYIVTTEKETIQKEQFKKLLIDLARDLSNGVSKSSLHGKYAKLFNSTKLNELYKAFTKRKYEEILENIRFEYEKYPTTYDLATTIANRVNKVKGHDLIKVVHYPYEKGVMGHQINYLIDEIKDSGNQDTYFAVYNADSRPNKQTLQSISASIIEYELANERVPNIIQQSSLFTNNYSSLPGLLKAAAMFQTKWTLVHEITRFRNQSRKVLVKNDNLLDKLRNTKLSHCVGHGLFVRLSHLIKHRLPTDTVNEDLPFGFYQCAIGEPILPVKILENSDSPETPQSLINQKKVWFWPYLEYAKCRNMALKRNLYRDLTELNILTLQGISTGIIWFFQSMVFLIPLLVSIIGLNLNLFFFWIFAWGIYWILPVGIIYKNLDSLEKQASGLEAERSVKDLLTLFIYGIPHVFIHSIGPYMCMYEYIQITRGKNLLVKDKTER